MMVPTPDFMDWVEVGENGLYVIEGAPEGTDNKLREWENALQRMKFEKMSLEDGEKEDD